MKKFLRNIALAPIMLVMMLCAFACGSAPKLNSISLTIEGASLSSGYYNIEKKEEGTYTIKTTLSSTDFDIYDLTWKSSNTNVATVYFNKLKTVGVGETTITASYKNSDGTEVKGTIRVNVNAVSALITFPKGELTTTYTGYNQKLDFLANEDYIKEDVHGNPTVSGLFTYEYYDYTTKQLVSQLKDAGKYKIICTSASDTSVQTTKDITIEKKTVSLEGINFDYISYGDNLPNYDYDSTISLKDSLFNQNDSRLSDTEFLNKSYNDILGVGGDGTIGKYTYTTSANKGSKVATYKTNVYYVLDQAFSRNYTIEATKTGAINIIAKNVEIELEPQTITYGSSIIPNKYALYEVGASEKTNLLQDATVDYASNILLGAPSFKVEKSQGSGNYQAVSLNDSGVLNVLYEGTAISTYKLFYDEATTSTGNIIIKNIISSDIKVEPRPVEILPTENQSKVYGTIDPQVLTYSVTKSSFLPKDSIQTFLYIDYSGFVVDNSDTDADTTSNPNYNYNINAQVGSYPYAVDNTRNKNYTISLHSTAQYEVGASTAGKVVFSVAKCPIYIEFESVIDNYQTPKGADNTYTISYFLDDTKSTEQTKSAYNYSTSIKSFVVNGVELVSFDEDKQKYLIKNEYLDLDFANNGVITIIANKTPNSQEAWCRR